MYSLPISIQINQASFGIRNKGDFRMVLDCFEAINDSELSELERTYAALIIFYEDFNDIDDLVQCDVLPQLQDEMIKFFNGGEESISSNTNNYTLIDWKKDSNLVCSAINNIAKQEIRALDYLHWWTFLSYYLAIGECPLTNIVSIRYKIAHGEKLEKYEQKFKKDNPEYFNLDFRSKEQQEADDYIRKLWGDDQ